MMCQKIEKFVSKGEKFGSLSLSPVQHGLTLFNPGNRFEINHNISLARFKCPPKVMHIFYTQMAFPRVIEKGES